MGFRNEDMGDLGDLGVGSIILCTMNIKEESIEDSVHSVLRRGKGQHRQMLMLSLEYHCHV